MSEEFSKIARPSIILLAALTGLTALSIDMNLPAMPKLQEVFGAGTAAVISPVGEIKYGEQVITIAGGEVGPLARKYYSAITDIQYGRAEDPLGWIVPVV